MTVTHPLVLGVVSSIKRNKLEPSTNHQSSTFMRQTRIANFLQLEAVKCYFMGSRLFNVFIAEES
ncbi:hypothetical protein J6590_059504 [Homalodisca vitripennis]|nr:hypothetical protein J6590_059504 [Homalodisca vitripennis]